MDNKPSDRTDEARQQAAEESDRAEYVLRLYVTGTTPRSLRAIQNLRQVCEEHLQGRYRLEVIDLYKHPLRTMEDQIVAVPTLIKQLPEPMRKIIGDMSNTERVLAGLNLHPKS